MDRINDDICIFPEYLPDTYAKDKTEHDVLLWSVLERIANHLELGKVEQQRHFLEMEEKINEIIRVQQENNSAYTAISLQLDELTRSVSASSTLLNDHLNGDKAAKELKKNISKVKDLRGQFLRAEKMSAYTDELLTHYPPFVQKKFRTKVSINTPTDEIVSYEDEAIQRARMETKRLRIRMNRWENDLAALNKEIQCALGDPNLNGPDKVKFEEQLKNDEIFNKKKSLTTFERVQKSCEKELNAGGTQFLLKYTEDRHSKVEKEEGKGRRERSRNQRHHSHHRRRDHTPPWRNEQC